jgi:hypothetical protein
MRSKEISRNVANALETETPNAERALNFFKIIADLEGVPVTRKQQFGISAIGSSISAFDAVFDRYSIDSAKSQGESLLDVVKGDGDSKTIDPRVSKAISLVHENLRPETSTALSAVTEAQINSIRQREENVDAKDIEAITRDKGSSMAMLFATEANPKMSPEKKAAYAELGYLLQLLDDLVDQERDAQEGVSTLATLPITKPTIMNKIKVQCDKVKSLFQAVYNPASLGTLFKHLDALMARSGVF